MKTLFYINPETATLQIHRYTIHEDKADEVLSNPGEDRPGKGSSLPSPLHREPTTDRLGARGEPYLFVPEDVLDQPLQHFHAMISSDDLGVHGQNESTS